MGTFRVLLVTWVQVLPAIASSQCVGDCDGNGRVDISELTRAVRIALQRSSVDECLACDSDGDRAIGVSELVAAVKAALSSCSTEPILSATASSRTSLRRADSDPVPCELGGLSRRPGSSGARPSRYTGGLDSGIQHPLREDIVRFVDLVDAVVHVRSDRHE